ncbi:DUF3293 domain-containing protein [Pseudofrankia sp. DC12]|uniref:DUF3293 domain-containing protein n=1 Tax=Pseudofrankia sp. DC12 TaxID=683315 RepID=UPI0005F85A72|nr:DUF3293 domain-containing protein [Pseudofrankia sp. DC12]
MSKRPNPTRADLLALLGAQPETSVAAICRSYLSRRRELLASDPDHRRPEVARLDDAFTRLRAATDLESRLDDYPCAEVKIGVEDTTVVVRSAPAGTASGEFPFPGVERVHVLTAFNPRSRRLRPHENANRQRALAGRVATTGLPSWPAVGGGRQAQTSIAVAGLTRARARALGAEFEQDAVVEWTPTAWSVVPCDELVAPREFGWRSSRLTKPLPDPAAAARRAEAAAAADRAATDVRTATADGLPSTDEARPADEETGPVSDAHEILVADAVRALAAEEAETAAIARARELTAATPAAGTATDTTATTDTPMVTGGPAAETGTDGSGGPAAGGAPAPRKADPAAGGATPDPHDLPASHGGNGE